MAEMNYSLLQSNIRALIKKHGITQNGLAEIAGMSQSNVSKALSPNDKKQFNLEQLYRISQHFGISIDELVGNMASSAAYTSPQALLALISKLFIESKVKSTEITEIEYVYKPYYNDNGYPDCSFKQEEQKYIAFYFPNYMQTSDFVFKDEDEDTLHYEFCSDGNESMMKPLNTVLEDFIPIVDMYLKGKFNKDAFDMVLNGYLEQLSDK
ncbi:MAG: helix-turn-helix transcriptional regulator [Clostridia bacterium]|nr:helix-turn-helix transcriptional regulator [Clostridia bacterium]